MLSASGQIASGPEVAVGDELAVEPVVAVDVVVGVGPLLPDELDIVGTGPAVVELLLDALDVGVGVAEGLTALLVDISNSVKETNLPGPRGTPIRLIRLLSNSGSHTHTNTDTDSKYDQNNQSDK